MALTERKEVTSITIVGQWKALNVCETTIVEKDGVEIARNKLRYVIDPGDDVTGCPDDVVTAANFYHTEELISSWLEHKSIGIPEQE